MNTLTVEDQKNIRQFIESRHLRHGKSPIIYSCILRDFQRFVIRHAKAGAPPSVQIVQRWLDERIVRWPLHIVFYRARLVDCYLDWMKAGHRLASNPLQELRSEYGQRTTTPIIRALLSSDRDAALERLRPLPLFGSFLGSQMSEHVALMRSMGHRYEVYAARLRRFDRFLQGRPDLAAEPLSVLIEAWRVAGKGFQHELESQQCGRLLSKALRRVDPTVAVMRTDPHLERRVREHHRRPYIYSEDEVRRLLEAALSFPSPLAPLRPLSLYTMFILAYCAGLRLSEIVHLNLGDVSIDDGTIEIRCTKFFKSRRLPLATTVMAAVKSYLDARQVAGAPSNAASGLFWHQQAAGRYSTVMAGKLLVRVLRRAGLKTGNGRIGPRVHDLRHAFVVNRMLAWYRSGINPQAKLPYLATYLGHKDINSTLVYLTITQELMRHASERFRVRGASALGAKGEQA